MTHWLDRSLVLASDYRVPRPDRVAPLLQRSVGLAELGTHHVLTYASTTERGRVLVLLAVHQREPVLDLLRSRVFFDWFDAAGIHDIPAVFAGELVERLDFAGEPRPPTAFEVMVAIMTPVDSVVNLVLHVRETAGDLQRAGVRGLLILSAFDDPGEVMMMFQIDDESHARHWLRESDLAVEWMGKAGIGVYPPVFVGRLQQVVRVARSDEP